MSTISVSNLASNRAGHGTGRPPTFRDVLLAPPFLASALLVLGAFVAVFHQWFLKQHQHSATQIEDWGHAYVIPLISGYMVWQRRDAIMAARPRVFWPGVLPVVLGLVCYFFFIVGVPNHMFQGFSLILTLFGVLLLLLGPTMMRGLFLPISYLVFGVTIAEMIMIKITFQLQQIAAQGAYYVLSVIGKLGGFMVDVAGNTLMIVDSAGKPHDLDVAEACSGMRMVIAFIALATAVALLSCKHWWQRTALILLAIPVAVLMNVARVAVLGLASLVDQDLAAGDAHMLIGTVLLLPGLGLFMLVVWALHKAVPEEDKKAAPGVVRTRLTPPHWAVLKRPAFLAAMVLMFGAALGMRTAIAQAKFHLQKLPIYGPDNRQLTDVPTRTASWQREGTDAPVSKEVEESLGTKNHVTRTYVARKPGSPARRPVTLHAAYYTGMVDTVPHVPERCNVGHGLQIKQSWGEVPVPLNTSLWREDTDVPEHLKGRVFEAPITNEFGAVVRYVRMPFDPANIKLRVTEFQNARGQRMMSGYFFIANGGTVASAEGVRLLAFNLTDSYAYYLKVQFDSGTAKTAEELAADAGALLDDLLPELMRCVPDWVQVERGEYPADNPAGGKV